MSTSALKYLHSFRKLYNESFQVIRSSRWNTSSRNQICKLRNDWLLGYQKAYLSTVSTRHNSKSSGNNVLLMGGPGAGKTSVAPLVAERLGRSCVIDIDNDILEKEWGCYVADKLAAVGGEEFLKEEGNTVMRFSANNSVVSLSGSNPLNPAGMKHLRGLGTVVYLDVSQYDIISRLEQMKVDRIVTPPGVHITGSSGDLMSQLLTSRESYYENCYDVRVIVKRGETLENLADNICKQLHRHWSNVSYISTRGDGTDHHSWGEAVLGGQPSDGGLFVPSQPVGHIGKLSVDEWQRLVDLDYPSRAFRVLERLIPHRQDLPLDYLRSSLIDTYTPSVFKESGGAGGRVVMLGERVGGEFINELFHGPTGSFKDVSLQLFPRIFSQALNSSNNDHRVLFIVATSGDTGSAVAHGFSSLNDSRVKVLVLYPDQGVTELQRYQLESSRSSCVDVVAVEADFDKCQSIVKLLLTDSQLAESLLHKYNTRLGVANSINWLRLVLQTVHHVSGYLDLVKQGHIYMGQEIDIAVPTGNFGNIYAAFQAKLMGIPVRKLICACNSNNILSELFNTGYYNLRDNRALVSTISPAIDILHSSNFERFLFEVSGGNGSTVAECYQQLEKEKYFKVPEQVFDYMKSAFLSDWCSDSTSLSQLKQTFTSTGYVMDTHTAVAYCVAANFKRNRKDTPLLLTATAHYSKSAQQVLECVDPSSSLTSLSDQLSRLTSLSLSPHMHYNISSTHNATNSDVIPPTRDVIPPTRDVTVKRIHNLLSR